MNTKNSNNQINDEYPEVAKILMELVNSEHVPQIHFDPGRLVDAWVIDAEGWLRYSDDVMKLTPLEAFEGIELLGRLTRTKPAMLTDSGGANVLSKIRAIYTGEHATHLLKLAFDAICVPAWLKQAKEMDVTILDTWEDTTECAQTLLEDLQAFELLRWWAQESGLVEDRFFHIEDSMWKGMDLTKFQEGVNDCNEFVAENASNFLTSEAQVRAIACTVREDLATVDRHCSGMGTLIYCTLLSEFERIAMEENAT